MDRPIPCSYNARCFYDVKTKEWYTKEKASSPYTNSKTPPVEHRGITLRQLLAIEANMERRCAEEGWVNHFGKLLTPKTVTLYDINKLVTKPFTKAKKQSCVTCFPSTAGPQTPRFFISHWWGNTFTDFIQCVEQAVRDFSWNGCDEDDRRGGGMTHDTPIWVCAFANNEYNLGEDIAEDPKDQGFVRALKLTKFRTISILDNDGVVFSRIWCNLELFLTLVDGNEEKDGKEASSGLWAVYTAHKHTRKPVCIGEEEKRQAVGIVSGGTTLDKGNSVTIAGRERAFPIELVEKSLRIKIEDAKASKEQDQVHILNSIIGRTGKAINDVPPKAHAKYDELNDALKATFVTEPILAKATKENDELWNSYLVALSKGKKKIDMLFKFNDDEWSQLTADRATELA